MIKIYGIGSCDKCRTARKWLRERDIEHHYHDLRLDGLDDKRLRQWQTDLGWELLINRRSITWKKIPTADRDNLSASSARRLISAYPTLLKRPLLEVDDSLVATGFSPDIYKQLTGRGLDD